MFFSEDIDSLKEGLLRLGTDESDEVQWAALLTINSFVYKYRNKDGGFSIGELTELKKGIEEHPKYRSRATKFIKRILVTAQKESTAESR